MNGAHSLFTLHWTISAFHLMFMLGSPCSIIMSSFVILSWSFLPSLLLSMNMTFLWHMSIITPESSSVMLVLPQKLLLCISECWKIFKPKLWTVSFPSPGWNNFPVPLKSTAQDFRDEDLSLYTHFHHSYFHQHTSFHQTSDVAPPQCPLSALSLFFITVSSVLWCVLVLY